jgi:2-polyprenyl-6-methoxyphenol hydroxylase-like FAD-dependent oxidoreductase
VGLFTAIELASTGLSVIIYDKRIYRTPHSRGLAVHGRTLSIMSSRGLLQPFLDIGVKVPVSHYGALGALVKLGSLDVELVEWQTFTSIWTDRE